MNRAIHQFELNLGDAKQLGVIFLAFCDKVTEAISLDELLRAEIVLGVSALDCYVHDLVRITMARAFACSTGEPNAYLQFGVSLGFVKSLLRTTEESDRLTLFDQEIRRLHGFKTFQNSKSISKALSLIGLKAIWDKAGAKMAMTSSDLQTNLDLVIDRRNRIAHESDIDPAMGIGAKYPIDFPTVQKAINFIDAVGHAIHDVAVREVAF